MDSKKTSLRSLVLEIVGEERLSNGTKSYNFEQEYDVVKGIFYSLYPTKPKIKEEDKKDLIAFLKVFYEARFDPTVTEILRKCKKGEVLSSEEILKKIELIKEAHNLLGDSEEKHFEDVLKDYGTMKELVKSMVDMVMLDMQMATINADKNPKIHLNTLESFIKAYQNADSLNQWRNDMKENNLKENGIIIKDDKILIEIKR